jgi:hypothetical protein
VFVGREAVLVGDGIVAVENRLDEGPNEQYQDYVERSEISGFLDNAAEEDDAELDDVRVVRPNYYQYQHYRRDGF